ncbi:MAG: GGDEF domain-containing protein, partial [Pseudomonadota bacterium]
AASPPSPVATPEPEPEPKGAAIVDRKALGARLEERLEAVRDAPDHDRTGCMVFLEIDSAYAIRRQQGLPFLESLADALEPHIAAVMRADDGACHYGDAAWCALFDGLSIGELEGKAREILGAVGRETFEIKGTRTKISVSAGICPLSDEFETADALISTAERICTRDAEQKDARISVHRAPTRPAEGDLRGLGEAIMEALDSDGFQMVYQPIASLQGQEVDQYQCLLRLPRPGQEPVAPARVIAAAQELGMLDQIDRWVARKAIELIAEDAGRSRPLRLFVNQSGEAATGEDAADFIVETLNQHTVSGPSLILEFKLTELARSLKAVVELTRRLEANRVRFCLGHFDGSETAFRILEYFHAEFVKLRPEVAFRQLQDGQLSETVQRLHEHRSQVVVTGVEEAQLAVQLWSSGVDFIQGHFVQKPESDLTYHFAGAG